MEDKVLGSSTGLFENSSDISQLLADSSVFA